MGNSIKYLLGLFLLVCSWHTYAQANNTSATPKKDTTMNKTNTSKWKNENVTITYEQLNSSKVYVPDTGIHTFHRIAFIQNWERDLGNLGSPINNLFFTTGNSLGPSLGYHVYDAYKYNVDSLFYYNTNRPYSIFSYQLGSKLEQIAHIMHSQNVKPNWNITFDYRKINSPGFYKIQRNNHDNVFLSTNYKSLNKHYIFYGAMVYNQEQHDENGGIVIDTQLYSAIYTDRKTIDVAFQNDQYSLTRSSVTNVLRDFTMLFQQSYVWGITDTSYNADSSQSTYKLVPKFGITHKMELSTEKHTFKDLTPDSLRYSSLFSQQFTNNSNGGYYSAGGDSVYTVQKWFWIDNKLLLNGYLGKENRQTQFSIGLGNRFDEFTSLPISILVKDSLPKHLYVTGIDAISSISNYFECTLKKEALHAGNWEYNLHTQLFLTGNYAGNLLLNGVLGKSFKNNTGSFLIGIQQQINNAPYNYTHYENAYIQNINTFNSENITSAYVMLNLPKWRLNIGAKNYIIDNYLYIDENELPKQYNIAFNLLQVWANKTFKLGNFYLDNQFVYQQKADNAPLNVPQFMGKHQLSYERAMFKNALKIATGIEIRYNTAYSPAGYDVLLNQFYYQKSSTTYNNPEAALFLNFRRKRFRAFIMADQLQQAIGNLIGNSSTFGNTLLFVGTPVINFNNSGINNIPVYATPDFNIKFGFNWIMIN